MEIDWVAGGLPALFVLAFLAATILPLGSEWLLAALVVAGSPATNAVLVAAIGNTLGACTTAWLGRGGACWLSRRMQLPDERRQRAERLFRRYGSWSLLFSWLPIIGDPLCLVAGILRIPWPRFLVLVALGKLGRYAAVAWLTLQVTA